MTNELQIGELCRNGKKVFYVVLDGFKVIENTDRAALIAKINPTAKVKTTHMYTVHVQPKFPAWDEKNGWDVEMRGVSKKEACERVRRLTRNAGHTGVIYFKATEVHNDD